MKRLILSLFLSCNTTSTASFENKVLTEINQVDIKGIKPEFILVVSTLETGHGKGVLYGKAHNLFSIKAEQGYKGNIFCVNDCYRSYSNDVSAINDFVRLISTRSRYKKAYFFAVNHQRKQFFQALQDAGYSEDKNYAKKLESCYQTLKLQKDITGFTQR